MNPSAIAASIVVVLYCLWYRYFYPHVGLEHYRDLDLEIYLHAARGNFTWMPEHMAGMTGWVYLDWVAIAWIPLAYLPVKTASRLWLALNLGGAAFLSYHLGQFSYGLLAIVFAKPIAVYVWTGNVGVLLSCLCCAGPLGAGVASLFKPHLFVFVMAYGFKAFMG